MEYSDITPTDIQDDIIGPIFINEYREQVTKRMKDDKKMRISGSYISSIYQDFESFLRTKIDLVEDDIRLVFDEYNSSFVTYELEPGIYTFEDLSEALYNNILSEYPGPSNVIFNKLDDISVKTKLVVKEGIIT